MRLDRLAVVVALAVVLSACGTSGPEDEAIATPSDPEPTPAAAQFEGASSSDADDQSTATANKRVVVGTAADPVGRALAHILAALLAEADLEPSVEILDPVGSVGAVAAGSEAGGVDLWSAYRSPESLQRIADSGTMWFDAAKSIVPIPGVVSPGGVEGFLVGRSWAHDRGVTSVDKLNATPELWTELDLDGDGAGDLIGCPREWLCRTSIDSYLAQADWTNLRQLGFDSYEAGFEAFMERVERGDPALIYLWAPSAWHAQAMVGEETAWLSVADASVPTEPLNDLGLDLGYDFSEVDSVLGVTGSNDAPSNACIPHAADCQLGFLTTGLGAAANADWLAANPVAAGLLARAEITLDDLSTAESQIESGSASADEVAERWIAENRGSIEQWLRPVSSDESPPIGEVLRGEWSSGSSKGSISLTVTTSGSSADLEIEPAIGMPEIHAGEAKVSATSAGHLIVTTARGPDRCSYRFVVFPSHGGLSTLVRGVWGPTEEAPPPCNQTGVVRLVSTATGELGN